MHGSQGTGIDGKTPPESDWKQTRSSGSAIDWSDRWAAAGPHRLRSRAGRRGDRCRLAAGSSSGACQPQSAGPSSPRCARSVCQPLGSGAGVCLSKGRRAGAAAAGHAGRSDHRYSMPSFRHSDRHLTGSGKSHPWPFSQPAKWSLDRRQPRPPRPPRSGDLQ
jgi:hypothetical protein